MKPRMRSSVSVVMRPPLRRRLASLPSFTARRPKVELGKAALAAEVGDFLQDCVVHGRTLGAWLLLGFRVWTARSPASLGESQSSRHFFVNHKASHHNRGRYRGIGEK